MSDVIIWKLLTMNLERLTIVIPSRNRHKYIQRAIDYWTKTPVQLLILDGTEQTLKLDAAHARNENVQYIHAVIPLEQRLGKATEYVKTEYVAVISDDEFFLSSSLSNCLDFLDHNPDYVACKGLAVSFGWDGRRVHWKLINKSLKGYNIDAASRSDRMFQHLSSYAHASMWSVQRREVFQSAMKAVGSTPPFPSAPCAELQVSLVTAFYGKIKVLDELMWLRSFENRSLWWKKASLSIREWWRDSAYTEDHKRFIDSVIAHATDTEGHSPTSAEIKAAMEALVLSAERTIQKAATKKRNNKMPEWYITLNGFVKTTLNNTIYRQNGYKGYSLISHIETAYPEKLPEVKAIVEMISTFQRSQQ